jgi:hypothetical protein
MANWSLRFPSVIFTGVAMFQTVSFYLCVLSFGCWGLLRGVTSLKASNFYLNDEGQKDFGIFY